MRQISPSRVQRLADVAQQEAQFTAEGAPPPGKVGLGQPEGSAATDAGQGPADRHLMPSSRTGVPPPRRKAAPPDRPLRKRR